MAGLSYIVDYWSNFFGNGFNFEKAAQQAGQQERDRIAWDASDAVLRAGGTSGDAIAARNAANRAYDTADQRSVGGVALDSLGTNLSDLENRLFSFNLFGGDGRGSFGGLGLLVIGAIVLLVVATATGGKRAGSAVGGLIAAGLLAYVGYRFLKPNMALGAPGSPVYGPPNIPPFDPSLEVPGTGFTGAELINDYGYSANDIADMWNAA